MSKVYILIGSVGAGKSTMAEKLHSEQNVQIISADEIYKTLPVKRISTKPYDHNIRNEILNKICEELSSCLKNDIDCVIDYTNMPTKRRRRFLTIAKRHNACIICKFLLVDKDILLKQLIKRETTNLASHVILQKEQTVNLYLKRVAKSSPVLHEGYSMIETYQNGKLVDTKYHKNKKRFLKGKNQK